MQTKRKTAFGSVRALTLAAMLTAMSVIIGIFCKSFLNFGNGLMRITFENLPIILSGIFFGPIPGAVVGAATDLISYLLSSQAYPPNLIVTAGAMSVGAVSGAVSRYAVRKSGTLQVILAGGAAHIVGSMIIKPIGLFQFYSWAVLIRIPVYLVIAPIEIFLICVLFRNKSFQRLVSGIKKESRLTPAEKESNMTYEKALEYIHSVCWKGSRPGLSRITELCHRLGDPQNGLKFVHVTGTNGKGSTCAMTESVLRSAGYKTGLFTSPYVKVFNERMAVNGENVSNERLAEVTAMVKPHADAMEDSPTEFELITAIAFMLFKLEGCDIVVLEAGMGGRLDSTNVIESAEVSVITGVALEHTEYLGDTVPKIAAEKAGIIKKGCPVVYGGRDYGAFVSPENEKTAYAVIKEKADELGCELSFCDYGRLSVISAGLDGATLDYKETKGVKIPLLGLYQPENCAKALEVIEALRKKGYAIPDEALMKGLAGVVWRARFERLRDDPLTLYDGSHNPEGICEAVRTLRYYFGEKRLNFLTGVMKDKDYTYMAETLAPLANEVFCVTPDNPRALSSEELKKVYSDLRVRSSAYETVARGVDEAIKRSREAGVPLICLGSLYMYAEVSDAVEANAE